MIYKEPRWKSYIVETTKPIFTPAQCQEIIRVGRAQRPEKAMVGTGTTGNNDDHSAYDTKKRVTTISWIPFDALKPMYNKIRQVLDSTNKNHFGFDTVELTEPAQFTEYPPGGFYDWHTDNDISGITEPPVRKISMTLLLSPETQFTGGGLELVKEGSSPKKLTQGHAIFFASFVRHRVMPVQTGVRQSLVMWFGGTPFR
jgi:PKHD-type hydroxylase